MRSRIVAGVAMLLSSMATLYAVLVNSPYFSIVAGIEVAVIVGLLAVINRKKPDDGLRGRPDGDGL